jgi:hypothetical protein
VRRKVTELYISQVLARKKVPPASRRTDLYEKKNEAWLRVVAQLSHRSDEQIRTEIPGFLDTNVFNTADRHCGSFLDPVIDSGDIDLKTFGLEVVLNARDLARRPETI